MTLKEKKALLKRLEQAGTICMDCGQKYGVYSVGCSSVWNGKCGVCGEVIPEFLSIDHINNDGNVERKQNNSKGGAKFYRELKERGFPKDNYQLLCMNCNFAKGHFGICPHQVMNLSVAPIMGINVV